MLVPCFEAPLLCSTNSNCRNIEEEVHPCILCLLANFEVKYQEEKFVKFAMNY